MDMSRHKRKRGTPERTFSTAKRLKVKPNLHVELLSEIKNLLKNQQCCLEHQSEQIVAIRKEQIQIQNAIKKLQIFVGLLEEPPSEVPTECYYYS